MRRLRVRDVAAVLVAAVLVAAVPACAVAQDAGAPATETLLVDRYADDGAAGSLRWATVGRAALRHGERGGDLGIQQAAGVGGVIDPL